MQGSVARDWNAANEEGKLDMLRHALKANCPLDMDLLDADKDEMDRLAALVGLVPVYVATVDGCGLSCQTPGVVSPAIASQYRARRTVSKLAAPVNRIIWTDLDKVGMPPRELWFAGSDEAPLPRKFLVRGDYTLECAYVFADGSGFDTDMAEPVKAWAVIDGF